MQSKKLFPLLLCFLILPLSYACGDQNFENDMPYLQGSDPEAPEEIMLAMVEDEIADGNSNYAMTPQDIDITTPGGGGLAQFTPEKVIKEGHLSIEVEDYAATVPQITGLLRKYKGYIAHQDENHSASTIRNNFELRVPNEKFEPLFEDLSNLAVRIDYRQSNVRDVSEEYVDITSRIIAKEKVEQRYLELLGQAKNIEEILQVETQLRMVQEELEAAKGRLKYLDDKIGYSTIQLDVYEQFEEQLAAYEGPGFWDDMGDGAGTGWEGVKAFFVGLVTIWPLLILGGFFWYFLRRYLRRSRERAEALRTPPTLPNPNI